MKICHVLRSSAWGGLEMYSLDFIQKLSILKIECILLCLPDTKVEQEAKRRGITVKTAVSLRKTEFTHIHVHRRQDLSFARWRLIGLKKPLLYSLYMSAPPKKDPYHSWIYKRLSALASSSEWVIQQVTEHFPISPNRVHLIRYGRDLVAPLSKATPAMNASIRKQTSNAGTGQLVLLSMSRIDTGKGLRELLEAYTALPSELRQKLHLWIMGDPTLAGLNSAGRAIYEPQALALWEHLHLATQNPEFSGNLKLIPFQKDPGPWLEACDLFFLGSHEETYSLSVIDSMLHEKACLGARSGGTIEQIGHQEERGYFFNSKDSQSLKQTLERILQQTSDIAAKSRKAREWAEQQHSWDHCLKQWQKIYSDSTS